MARSAPFLPLLGGFGGLRTCRLVPEGDFRKSPAKGMGIMERARFRSLDVFRGMAICLMIVVNTPGAGSDPWPVLDHADWFGFTAADIVFPSFLFAVGNAMAFGALKDMTEGDFWRKTLRRTAISLALGF